MEEAFGGAEDGGHLREGDFEVDLGEVGLTIGAEVFVAEAAGDLEVAVEAGDHEDLLEDLRRLRQREEVAGVDAAGDEVVARAFGGGAGEERRFDLEEAVVGEVVADGAGDLVAQREVVLQLGAAEVEVAVLEADLFVGDGRRRRARRAGSSASLSSRSSWATISMSPVAMLGLVRPSPRLRTAPVTATTYSERAASALAWAAGETSLSRTTWVMPVRSRRSRKMRLPWSRRRLTQPMRVTVSPELVLRGVRRRCACAEACLESRESQSFYCTKVSRECDLWCMQGFGGLYCRVCEPCFFPCCSSGQWCARLDRLLRGRWMWEIRGIILAALPAHIHIHVSADGGGSTCYLIAADEASLTCGRKDGGPKGQHVFPRAAVQKVKLTRYGVSTIAGAGIGAGVGAGIGFAGTQNPNGWFKGDIRGVVTGLGAGVGALAIGPTDLFRGPTVYRRSAKSQQGGVSSGSDHAHAQLVYDAIRSERLCDGVAGWTECAACACGRQVFTARSSKHDDGASRVRRRRAGIRKASLVNLETGAHSRGVFEIFRGWPWTHFY